jgi:ABC-type transport system involved in cytochrome bd biosynthesis fused ATPase/permease subunit
MIDFGGRNTSWPWRIFNPLAQVVVAVYLVLDSIFRTVFRPLSRWLAHLRLVIRLEEMIAGLPAYGVLALLILPFAVAEPAKVFAVYLIGTGHIMVGLALMIAAYIVSILVVDRIFQAGKTKLLSIPWFAKLWARISNYKDKFLTWVKSTAAWKRVGEIKQNIRDMVSKLRKRFAW